MKKILSMIMTLVMVVTTLTISNISVKADITTDQWKTNAITEPANGKLIGAGYINIKFDSTLSNAKEYQVFFDDKAIYENDGNVVRTDLGETNDGATVRKYDASTCGDVTTCEVYTTSISAHTAYVVATLNDNTKITSDTLTFYVSKKGMALGGDMSDKVSLEKLNCSWYYNWSLDAFNNSIDGSVDHVPMMWGAGEDNIESMKKYTNTANYFLGFNEPDIASQANMKFFQGIETWNEYIKPLNVRKVSAAPASPGGQSDWLLSFMNGDYKCLYKGEWVDYYKYKGAPEAEATKTWVEGVNDDVDAVVLHYYRNVIDLNGLLKAVDNLWNTYHKPIWITELSLFGTKGTNSDFSYEKPEVRKQMAEFVNGIVTELDKIPYVERYCWFSYDIDSTNDIDSYNGSGGTSMFEYSSGKYTELGKLYSTIGNPLGYQAQTINADEMYVEPKVETTTAIEINTTTKPIATIKSTTTKKVIKKPSKVSLKKVQNIKKKSVKLTWKKQSNAVKYNIQYSMNKKFKKGVKNKYTKKITYTVSKLKLKKNYYFRVRAINNKGKGVWSKIKKVKIKK